jgi:glycolate oxidase iron-sulfur subunit
VEAILQALGHTLVPVADGALCCGSAGPYSVRHPRLATALGRRKWQALTGADPEMVVTANIGCQQHLARHGDRPVHHWLDLVYDALTNRDRVGRD